MNHHRKQQQTGKAAGPRGGLAARAADASADFHATLSAYYLQRWAPGLFEALAAPTSHVALLNAFAHVHDADELGLSDRVLSAMPVTCLRFPACEAAAAAASYPPPPRCPYTSLKQWCWLDLAAVLPPLLLGVQPHHAVLNMCAAPGGQSLVLAMQLLRGSSTAPSADAAAGGSSGGLTADMLAGLSLTGGAQQQQEQPPPPADTEAAAAAGPPQAGNGHTNGELPHDDGGSSDGGSSGGPPLPLPAAAAASSSHGRLVCNEADPARRSRLSNLLADYLPGSERRHVRVTGHEPAKHWGRFEAGLYDRVLLDAPCCSERHVVQAAIEAGGIISSAAWTRQRCAQLAAQQLKMLLAGLRALKPGGRLVFTTCSLAAAANDAVVLQALADSAQQVRLVPMEEWGLVGSAEVMQAAGGEATAGGGMMCLPDTAGWGPVFMALLEKRASLEQGMAGAVE